MSGTASQRGSGPVGVAIIGAGTISDAYLKNLTAFPDIDVVGIADIELERAEAKAEEYGVPVHGDVDTVLANQDVEVVVNLTIPAAHVSVATAALRAGKHVYGEKPLTLDREQGKSLLAEADSLGLRVGSAPDTFLGAGLQTTQRLIAEGAIGEPISAITCFQNPGPERWHPSPEFLFAVGGGPLLDIGPYYVTALVQLLGPVRQVAGVGRKPKAQRVIGSGPKAGQSFEVEVPTYVTALLEFRNGPVSTSVLTFDSPVVRNMIEITGTEATIGVPDPNQFGGPVLIRKHGSEDWEELPVQGTTAGRGLGVLDFAQALRGGRQHRASGALAMHVCDTLFAIADSAESGSFVPVTVEAINPEPLPADWDPQAATL